jgi:phage tail-like protein
VPETAARVDPLLAFRFRVRLDDLPVASFSDCMGLQVETEVYEYAEGGLNTNVHRLPTRTKHGSITLKRGIAGRDLWNWYEDIIAGRFGRRNGTIAVYDAAGEAVVTEWQFVRSFPCRWIGPDLGAAQSNVAVEAFELCHEGLSRRR